MKTLKNFALAAASLLVIATVIYAQGPGGEGQGMSPEQRREAMLQRMKTELSLTDAQVDAIRKLNQSTMQQGTRPDPEAREKMREQRNAEMKKILTPEQFQKWTERQQSMRQRGEARGPQAGPDQRRTEGRRQAPTGEQLDQHLARMKTELTLTDQQVEDLKFLFEDQAAKQRQNREENASEQKKAMEKRDAQVKKILTPEQYEQWLQMRQQRGQGRKGDAAK